MKNLLIFIGSLSSGGAERVTANLANYWAAKGWSVMVVTLAPLSLDFYELHRAVARIALNQTGDSGNPWLGAWHNLRRVWALRRVRRVWALRRVLRAVRPDLALSMMNTANVLLALAAWGLPVCAIGSERIHPPQCPLGRGWATLRRQLYGRLAAVTALTAESAAWLKTHTRARQVPVIPNAAPWPLPMQSPGLEPASVGVPGRQRLLAVGRLDPQKGFDLLIAAFAMLAGRHPHWELMILGEGSLRSTLEAQIDAANLRQQVFLPGRAGNIGQWYEGADLYVMSSRFEGFPNTLAEALACGLPAVSFDCDTGPRDLIRHEVDGLLVAAGDVAGLTAALDRLMGDAALRQRFAERAVEARERFSMERIAGLWEDLFEELR